MRGNRGRTRLVQHTSLFSMKSDMPANNCEATEGPYAPSRPCLHLSRLRPETCGWYIFSPGGSLYSLMSVAYFGTWEGACVSAA
jgi:hypothetical protein